MCSSQLSDSKTIKFSWGVSRSLCHIPPKQKVAGRDQKRKKNKWWAHFHSDVKLTPLPVLIQAESVENELGLLHAVVRLLLRGEADALGHFCSVAAGSFGLDPHLQVHHGRVLLRLGPVVNRLGDVKALPPGLVNGDQPVRTRFGCVQRWRASFILLTNKKGSAPSPWVHQGCPVGAAGQHLHPVDADHGVADGPVGPPLRREALVVRSPLVEL